MADIATEQQQEGSQLRLAAMIFGGIIALLVVGYFLILRFNFATIYQNLTSEEAAAVVAELDLREIKYRLKNGGSEIQVPAYKAASVRLAIVDAEAPAKKLVGFELFDESEMGLTDFAQKIKYQRALQGELARTIMMMDGVANARVHIAIPERALFRGNEASQPKAAVTIVTRESFNSDETLIAGIQRLVAAAVPELQTAQVVVLNADGEEISEKQGPSSGAVPSSPGLDNEQPSLTAENQPLLTNENEVSDGLPTPSLKTLVASTDSQTIPVAVNDPSRDDVAPATPIVDEKPENRPVADYKFPVWLAAAIGFLVLVFLGLVLKRVLKTALNDEERQEFADTLKTKLVGFEESENVT